MLEVSCGLVSLLSVVLDKFATGVPRPNVKLSVKITMKQTRCKIRAAEVVINVKRQKGAERREMVWRKTIETTGVAVKFYLICHTCSRRSLCPGSCPFCCLWPKDRICLCSQIE